MIEITQEFLHKYFEYKDGKLYYKPRDIKEFSAPIYHKIWTTQWCGKEAGSKTNTGYWEISIKGRRFLRHRLIWLYHYGKWPDNIDHEDQHKSNDHIENLRSVSHTINMKNRKRSSNNKTGVNGVHICNKKYRAQIYLNGKCKHLGMFDTLEEAKAVRIAAEVESDYHENHGKG